MVAIRTSAREGPGFGMADVRFGSKADICGATLHVRFTPNSDRKSGHQQTVMSALPLKADMCSAAAHVCFGPKADIHSFDRHVSTRKQLRWHIEAESLGGSKVDRELKFCGQLDWKVARSLSFQDSSHVNAGPTVRVHLICAVTDQSASIYIYAERIARGDCMQCSKPNQLAAPRIEKWPAADKQRAGSRPDDARKHGIYFLLASDFESKNFLPAGSNCRLYFASLGLTRYGVWVL
jgi:hypothetical protein